MPRKPARTINIYDKGSNYLLLDSDDVTPLYNVHWNGNSAPHMTVTRPSDPNIVVGTATYHAQKKGGFFATASNITLKIGSRTLPMNKEGGVFSANKRSWQSAQGQTLYWKGGYAASGFLKLVDDEGKTWVSYLNRQYSGVKMGIFEITVEPVSEELLDEIVVSGCAMISEEKTSMTAVAASISSAGGGC